MSGMHSFTYDLKCPINVHDVYKLKREYTIYDKKLTSNIKVTFSNNKGHSRTK